MNTNKDIQGLSETLSNFLQREMPAGTVIGDPTWWADRISRAILATRQPAPVAADAVRGDGDNLQRFQKWASDQGESAVYIGDSKFQGIVANKMYDDWCAAAHPPADAAPSWDSLIGMAVSVDVSTGDRDATHRYFGKVDAVQQCDGEKGGVILMVQEPSPNFAPADAAPVLEPVAGDLLPPIGSRVFILHGRDDDAHPGTVTGYYAWKGGDKPHLCRVFVRMVYEGTATENARLLADCWPTAEAALASRDSHPSTSECERETAQGDVVGQQAVADVVKYTRLARGIQNPADSHPNGPWEDFYACDDVMKALSQRATSAAPDTDIFDLIREWEALPEGKRGDAARKILGCINQSYSAGVADGRALVKDEQPTQADSEDAARLDFMAQHEAWIAWSKDGESCRVFVRNEDGEHLPMMGWIPEAWAHNARDAIDAARKQTGGA